MCTYLRQPAPGRPEQLSPKIALEVCDTGHGMDEETCRRCLEPFFSTKGQRGTGLGLAMAYGVMQRHGGAIEIDTKPDQGTTMRLVFPVLDSIPLATSATPLVFSSAPLKVLCVDDEPLLRDVLRQILESGGRQPVLAEGGMPALELFRQAQSARAPFDVVIADLGMPHLDGRQFAKAIKKESPATPVILLTGWGKFMQEDGDISPEVDGILTKPPRLNEVYNMLEKVVQHRA